MWMNVQLLVAMLAPAMVSLAVLRTVLILIAPTPAAAQPVSSWTPMDSHALVSCLSVVFCFVQEENHAPLRGHLFGMYQYL